MHAFVDNLAAGIIPDAHSPHRAVRVRFVFKGITLPMIAEDRSTSAARQQPTAQSYPQSTVFARNPALVASYLLVLLVAAWPRVLDLGRFVTEDEGNYWLRRSDQFLRAISRGDWGATAITDHPGVTTMWLGSAGIVLRRTLFEAGIVLDQSFSTLLGLMEFPAALVHIAAILLGYALLRRLLDGWSALLAAILWAVDPFMIGYSRVLHVDALAATFMMLGVLFACVYWYHDGRWWLLVASAVCAALGFLSKSPGIALAPVVAGIAMHAAWRDGGGWARYRRAVVQLAVWGVVALVAAMVVWPALWANLPAALYQLRLGIIGEGAVPHALGAYFFDVVVAPGPAFYPTTIALRTTPITLVALLLLPLVWRQRRSDFVTRRTLAALAWYVLLFTAMLTLSPKKFNRYLVPVFPALDVLAAVALVWSTEWIVARSKRVREGGKRWAYALMVGGVTLGGSLNVLGWHPYALAGYNQLLGGAPMGARVFMAGWGEGLEQVAAWLNEQPNITGVLTVTTMRAGLQAYLKPGAQSMSPADSTLPPQAGYVVVYKQQAQMKAIGPPFDQFYGKVEPLFTVRIHGVEYAWVYEAPPSATPVEATFGEGAAVYGYRLEGPARRGQPLPVTVVWKPHTTIPEGTMLFAHLLAPDGQRVANVDVPVSSASWQPDRYGSLTIPLDIPATVAHGSYRLVVGLYALEGGQRLTLRSPQVLEPAVDGPDALLLATINVE
jgi:4-amino-4-deoxy-L-arabinose transferase-like glycosyltransferase